MEERLAEFGQIIDQIISRVPGTFGENIAVFVLAILLYLLLRPIFFLWKPAAARLLKMLWYAALGYVLLQEAGSIFFILGFAAAVEAYNQFFLFFEERKRRASIPKAEAKTRTSRKRKGSS